MEELSIESIEIENNISKNGTYDSATDRFIPYVELEIQKNRFINLIKTEYPKVKRIALFMNQSIDYMFCFLALYDAGLVPMPISPDTDNPPDRLASFVECAEIDLIITTSTYQRHPFFTTAAAKKLSKYIADVEKSKLMDYSDTSSEAILIKPNNNDIGYIVNTSGSMGKPKQVILPRGGLLFCIKGHIEALGINSRDNIAAFADVAFDAHIIEMYMAKVSYANLFIVPNDCRRDLTKLSKYYQKNKITVAVFVASMLRKCEPKKFPDLRVIICTGEKIDDEIIKKWGNRLLVDGYGPAENTIATWLKLIHLKAEQKEIKMIMIPETKCYILQENENIPVEQGKEGELCIAGPGVALGYTDRNLTKERFSIITDPNNPQKQIRVYRTRDLVRQNNDGSIDIVGRLDRQIKVYGKLVCPEEIEITIKEMEKNISAVYVDAKINELGHPDFVSYIELYDKEKPLDLSYLYENIKLKLGQTFIPTRWVIVEKLPQSCQPENNY